MISDTLAFLLLIQITLVHKAPEGYVDLQFARQGQRIAELEQINAAMLRDGLKFAAATKSAALRT